LIKLDHIEGVDLKKLVVLFFSVIFMAGCSNKEKETSIESTNIVVSENGEFVIKGTSKDNSSFYLNDQMIASKEQDKEGNFSVRAKMEIPETSANFKIKYLSEELLDETLTFDVFICQIKLDKISLST
ncbi:MAG: hypothetical protein ACK5IC_10955, partial [Moheibacter sp.]